MRNSLDFSCSLLVTFRWYTAAVPTQCGSARAYRLSSARPVQKHLRRRPEPTARANTPDSHLFRRNNSFNNLNSYKLIIMRRTCKFLNTEYYDDDTIREHSFTIKVCECTSTSKLLIWHTVICGSMSVCVRAARQYPSESALCDRLLRL